MLYRILGFAASAGFIAGSGVATAVQAHTSSTTFEVHMTNAQETPPNKSKASGSATFTLSDTKLTYAIEVKRLSGAATAAHIHVGAPGVAGPPIYTFAVKAISNGGLSHGSVDLTRDVRAGISGDSLARLIKSGNAYINVHTVNFPNGEIRGQLVVKR